MTRTTPKYVHGYIDRHGKPRWYFRRTGLNRVPLPGLPWSPEFMTAYTAALAEQPLPVGNSKIKAGSIRALAIAYFGSASFAAMKPRTQRVRRNILENFCRQKDPQGQEFGEKSAATLQREHIVKFMAARADKPESANDLRKALRAMMQNAVESGLRKDDPTRDVKAIRSKSDGFHSWTDGEITQFEQHHPIGTRPRLALALLLYTAQRRSDMVTMGRQHVREGGIQVRQQKTGKELTIPVHPELAAIIAASPSDHLTFLTTEFGQPFTAAGFGNWFRDQCNTAGLRHCSAHGLRKAAARRLAEAGCTEHEIASITGHATLREIVRYTKAADQKRLAAAAMDKIRKRTQWLTSTPVSQTERKAMINQSSKRMVVPRGGIEPPTP